MNLKLQISKVLHFSDTFFRFPVTTIFTAILTLFCYILLFTSNISSIHIYSIHFLVFSVIISLFFELWKEEQTKNAQNLLWIITEILVLVDTIYLSNKTIPEPYEMTGRLAVFISFLVGIVILPFLKEKNDIQMWNFCQELSRSASVAVISAMVCIGAIALLLFGIETLFSVEIDGKSYLFVIIPFGTFIPVSFFLNGIPLNEGKHNDNMPAINPRVIRYLFFPLLFCYFIVLYLYLFKILWTWELPRGMVSIMVSIMMLGFIFVEILIYPIFQQDNYTKEKKIINLIPWLTIPLLLLMSVGIIRRISDYGITPRRLYLLLVNIWFYVVCIYVIIKKSRRIIFIPVSFCILFLLSSAQPFNFSSLTKCVLEQQIESVIKSYPPESLPMSYEDFKKWSSSLPLNDVKTLRNRIVYLEEHYGGESATKKWISFKTDYWSFMERKKIDDDEMWWIEHEHREKEYQRGYWDVIKIPQGYTKMERFDTEGDYLAYYYVRNHNGRMDTIYTTNNSSKIFYPNEKNQFVLSFLNHEFVIDTADFDKKELVLKSTNSEVIFVPMNITVRDYTNQSADKINAWGYLFSK